MAHAPNRDVAAAEANLPLPPEELVRRLRDMPFVIDSVEAAGGGVMGAKRLGVTFRDDGVHLSAKWKAAPAACEGWNNSPRREIGVYEVQRLFLDPADYPVPPVAARAIPLDVYGPVDPKATATLNGTRCVFGALAVWLENAEQPKKAFDPERFARDPAYAFHFANLNLLAYLVAHRDARSNNFLMSRDPTNPRVFSIDNGIAFGGVLYNFFTWHFDEIRTSGLPKRSIDRLRRVTAAQLASFAVLGQWEPDADGVLQAVPPDVNWDTAVGTRLAGTRLQIGLTNDEIAALADRLASLLSRIDAGDLALF